MNFAHRIQYCKTTNHKMMENDIIIIVFVLKRRISLYTIWFCLMRWNLPRIETNSMWIWFNWWCTMVTNTMAEKRFNSSSFFYYLFLKLISHCNLHLNFIHVWMYEVWSFCTKSNWCALRVAGFWMHSLLSLLWSSFIPNSIWLFFISSKMFISLPPPNRCLRSTGTIHAWI